MAERPESRLPEPKMDATSLYREEIYTDRQVGTIRVLTPVKTDGAPDPARPTLYVGEAQIYTTMQHALVCDRELSGRYTLELQSRAREGCLLGDALFVPVLQTLLRNLL